jgi:hypothetical protein
MDSLGGNSSCEYHVKRLSIVIVRVDLNEDRKTRSVGVRIGPTTCGTRGCNAYVLRPRNNELQLMSEMSLAGESIIVSEHQFVSDPNSPPG